MENISDEEFNKLWDAWQDELDEADSRTYRNPDYITDGTIGV